jgi:hypothetical protein
MMEYLSYQIIVTEFVAIMTKIKRIKKPPPIGSGFFEIGITRLLEYNQPHL